jgi:PTS system nitrogen regulatory IIA component
MRLEPLLQPDRTHIVTDCTDLSGVLRTLAERAHESLRQIPAETLHQALMDREKRYPTTTPEGVAFPHAMLSEISDTLVIVAVLRPSVAFNESSHPPVQLVFGMFGSAAKPFQHVRLLARLARIVKAEPARQRLIRAGDAAALYDALIAEDRAHA